MKRRTKAILIFFSIAGATLLACSCALILYHHHHPSVVKSLVERFFRQSFGCSLTIRSFSYRLKPLEVRAQGLTVKPAENGHGFHGEIDRILAEMELRGSFGQKTLVFKMVRIKGFSFFASERGGLPEFKRTPTSLLSRIVKGIVGFFLFRDIRIKEMELAGGAFNFHGGNFLVGVADIHARMDMNGLVDIMGRAQIRYSAEEIPFSAPDLCIGSEAVFPPLESRSKGMMTLGEAALESRGVNVDRLAVKMRCTYDNVNKQLTIAPMNLEFEGVTAKDRSLPQTLPLKLGLRAEALLDLENRRMETPSFDLSLRRAGAEGSTVDVLQLKGALRAEFSTRPQVIVKLPEGHLHPQEFVRIMSETTRKDLNLNPLTHIGPVEFTGTATGSRESKKWDWHMDAEMQSSGSRFCYTAEKIQLDGGVNARFHAEGRLPELDFSLNLEGEKIKMKVPGLKSIAMEPNFTAKGTLHLRDNRIEAGRFTLAEREMFELGGRLETAFGTIRIEGLHGFVLPEKLLSLLPDKGGAKGYPDVVLSGPVLLRGSVSCKKSENKRGWRCDLGVKLKENALAYRTGDIQFTGKIYADVQASGEFPEIEIAAETKLGEGNFQSEAIVLRDIKALCDLSGRHPLYRISNMELHIAEAEVASRRGAVKTVLHAQNGILDAGRRSLSLPRIAVKSPFLKNLRISLLVDGKRLTTEVEGKDSGLLESASALAMIPAGWKIKGSDSIRVKALKEKGRAWSFVSRVGFEKLSFQNQDGSLAGEDVSIRAEMDGNLDHGLSSLTINGSLDMDRGEILYDRFYINLDSNPFSLSFARSEYGLDEKSLDLPDFKAGLKDLLAFRARGTFNGGENHPFHFSVHIPETRTGALFDHFIREPFQSARPSLKFLDVAGALSGRLDCEGDDKGLAVKGRVRWHNGKLSWREKGISLTGIHLDLPLWYYREKSIAGNAGMDGELRIESLEAPLLLGQSLRLPLEAEPNLLSVRSSITLKTPGGEVQMGPMVVRDIFSPRPLVATSLTLKSLEIDPLLPEIWPGPTGGILRGALDLIELREGALRTRGEISAEVFDGRILLTDLAADGLWSPAPKVKLNAEIEELSLGALTEETSFGKMEGVLKGYVRHLEIAYGQPQGFDLLLETVRKRGVPQKVSVKAVDNIAKLSGGQSPFMGIAGGFASVFEELYYQKIGARASLENDVFRINGTIEEGGVEYLMKGPFILGVNIVNQNPDNRIHFREMVKRVKSAMEGAPPAVK